jgi:hypothetical protein
MDAPSDFNSELRTTEDSGATAVAVIVAIVVEPGMDPSSDFNSELTTTASFVVAVGPSDKDGSLGLVVVAVVAGTWSIVSDAIKALSVAMAASAVVVVTEVAPGIDSSGFNDVAFRSGEFVPLGMIKWNSGSSESSMDKS